MEATPHFQPAELVDKYSSSVYKFCRSLTYTKEDADDLFQDTFLSVFERLSKLNGSSISQGYLFSAALFIWKSRKRKYARRNRLAPSAQMEDAVASGESIEENFAYKEEIRIVREVVDALPEKLKIPIILYYTMEMSVADIAETMKLPEGTVKSRLHKARTLVKKGLADLL